MKARSILFILFLAVFTFANENSLIFNYSNTNDVAPSFSSSFTNEPQEPKTLTIIWSNKAPIPHGRYWAGGKGVVRDTFYVCGGRCSLGQQSTRKVHAYIPETNTWIEMPSMPAPRRAGAGGRIGNKIYYAGGRDSLNTTTATLFEFDCDTKTWTQKANMPAGRWACCGDAVGGKLYVVGDENRTGTTYEYDPTTNSWTQKATLPVGRGWSAAAGAQGKLYVFGGAGSAGVLNDCWEFDPQTNTWTQKANMPGPREYHSAVAFNDTAIFIIGGTGDGTNPVNTVWRYSVLTNTWEVETPMPTARGWTILGAYQDKIYVVGGSIDWGTTRYLAINEEGSFITYENDVGIDVIRSPSQIVSPNSQITPIAKIKNFGTLPQQDIPVYCWIDSSDVRIYEQSVTYPGPLAPNDTVLITFPVWQVGDAGNTYRITMFTNLPNDTNRGNDTLRQNTFSFLVRDTLVAPFREITPTVDGVIDSLEWRDALKVDISDVLNMQGSGARPAGSVFLYCKHDSSNVYWALDFKAKTIRENYDQFGCYLDENYSRTWTLDSSEGNHWFVWLNQDTVIYRALLGTGNIPSAYWTRWASGNGILRTSTNAGNLQFEAVVNKGALKWNYTINPEWDTVGFYAYVAAAPGNVFWGTWPTTMPGTQWNNAAAYGTLIFAGLHPPMVEEENTNILKKAIINNIFKMPLRLTNTKTLWVYDTKGSLVKKIETKKEPIVLGPNNFQSGIYFLKIDDSKPIKAVILK